MDLVKVREWGGGGRGDALLQCMWRSWAASEEQSPAEDAESWLELIFYSEASGQNKEQVHICLKASGKTRITLLSIPRSGDPGSSPDRSFNKRSLKYFSVGL